MSELDIAKEQIAYLKLWLGILVVTEISVWAWLISNFDSATALLMSGAAVTVAVLTGGILMLHGKIERRIKSLRKL